MPSIQSLQSHWGSYVRVQVLKSKPGPTLDLKTGSDPVQILKHQIQSKSKSKSNFKTPSKSKSIQKNPQYLEVHNVMAKIFHKRGLFKWFYANIFTLPKLARSILSNYHFCMTNAPDTLELIQVALPSRKSKISKNLIFLCFWGRGF